MNSMRIAPPGHVALWQPCCRCGQLALGWDRINTKPFCPGCQESLIQGDGQPLVEATHRRKCTICTTVGTIALQTFPLHASRPVEMDLCAKHLRGFLGRKLGGYAYTQLRRQLAAVGIDVHDVFLLHEAFYDAQGRALQPTAEPDG